MSSLKYGSSSGGGGGGDDPFKNNTPNSMSKKLKEPKKKKGDSKKREEEQALRRRMQNRNSQRAYRDRREQRLRELEAEVQEAELLNQTLTSAYQELRAEMERLEVEKSQEEYYESLSGQPGSSNDLPYTYTATDTTGAGGQGGPSQWGDNNWVTGQWESQDYSNQPGSYH